MNWKQHNSFVIQVQLKAPNLVLEYLFVVHGLASIHEGQQSGTCLHVFSTRMLSSTSLSFA